MNRTIQSTNLELLADSEAQAKTVANSVIVALWLVFQLGLWAAMRDSYWVMLMVGLLVAVGNGAIAYKRVFDNQLTIQRNTELVKQLEQL